MDAEWRVVFGWDGGRGRDGREEEEQDERRRNEQEWEEGKEVWADEKHSAEAEAEE